MSSRCCGFSRTSSRSVGTGAGAYDRATVSVELISAGDRPLCYIVRQQNAPEATTFVTPDDAIPQVGLIVHPAGHEVKRHYHVPLERQITGTPEVLVVRQGRCEMKVYDDD